jgi:hypothetical protein
VATTALVDSDIEIGRRILATLTRASIPVTVSLWALISDLQEWRFIVATPLVDTKGPLAAYGEVNRALQKEGVFDDVRLRNIFLKSPNDKVLKSLEKESRFVPHEDFRVVNAPIAGSFVEDAYVYTGFIHVVRLRNHPDDHPIYSVIYAPYEGPGGLVPSVRKEGAETLRKFLGNRLHIDAEWIDSALRHLGERGSASIPNVELKTGDLKRLGLA